MTKAPDHVAEVRVEQPSGFYISPFEPGSDGDTRVVMSADDGFAIAYCMGRGAVENETWANRIIESLNRLAQFEADHLAGVRAWQSIETAPRDGNEFLAWGAPEDTEFCQIVFYDPSEGRDIVTNEGNIFPAADWCWAVVDGPTLHKSCFSLWMPLDQLLEAAALTAKDQA